MGEGEGGEGERCLADKEKVGGDCEEGGGGGRRGVGVVAAAALAATLLARSLAFFSSEMGSWLLRLLAIVSGCVVFL